MYNIIQKQSCLYQRPASSRVGLATIMHLAVWWESAISAAKLPNCLYQDIRTLELGKYVQVRFTPDANLVTCRNVWPDFYRLT